MVAVIPITLVDFASFVDGDYVNFIRVGMSTCGSCEAIIFHAGRACSPAVIRR